MFHRLNIKSYVYQHGILKLDRLVFKPEHSFTSFENFVKLFHFFVFWFIRIKPVATS